MIRYFEEKKVFLLETVNTSYAMQIMEDGHLCHLYWGEKIGCLNDLPTVDEHLSRYNRFGLIDRQEYPGWGEGAFNMHALKTTYADGTRNAVLLYDRHVIDGESLSIFLKDVLGIQTELRYTLRPELDIIERSSVITNLGSMKVNLENAFSATWRFPDTGAYRLTHLAGSWGKEYQPKRQILDQGVTLIETKTIRSGPTNVPLFMLDQNAEASEHAGNVYFGTLIYSGNFRIYAEVDEMMELSVTGGVSDFDFDYPLDPGESFETPKFIGGMSFEGFGGSARLLHRYQRNYLMRKCDADRVMPVIINTYGTFLGNVNEEKVLGILDKAEQVGAEAFIIDAGWSGVGDFYQLGMGDWNINKERFPGQLKNISDICHEKGMMFGLWLEPEIAHEDSRLAKEHPEWILGYPSRPSNACYIGRLYLNFGLDEVWQNILEKVCHLIDTCRLDYFKMDLNRWINEIGCAAMPPEQQKTICYRYAQGIYKFYHALAARYPNLMIENCAGGGTRVDLGMTAFSGRINRSDNQDPLDILKIHEGFTYFMLSKFAGGGCHISSYYTTLLNGRQTTTKFQADVAMMGSLAIGEDLAHVSDEKLQEIAGYVERFKELREITNQGEVYHLASAWEHPYAVFEYVLEDKSQACICAYGQSMQFHCKETDRILLRGLDSDAMYEVEGMGIRSGRGLMHAGIVIPLHGDMDSTTIKLTRVQ